MDVNDILQALFIIMVPLLTIIFIIGVITLFKKSELSEVYNVKRAIYFLLFAVGFITVISDTIINAAIDIKVNREWDFIDNTKFIYALIVIYSALIEMLDNHRLLKLEKNKKNLKEKENSKVIEKEVVYVVFSYRRLIIERDKTYIIDVIDMNNMN